MRLRIQYEKTEEGRFLSHLDLAKAMERTLRRVKAPLAFSEGFNPHPKIAFASALAVGITGKAEYMDVTLRRRVNLSTFEATLKESAPKAITIKRIHAVPLHTKSLSALVNLAHYTGEVSIEEGNKLEILSAIERVLAEKELWRLPKVKPGKKAIPAKEVRSLVRWINATLLPGNRMVIEMALVLGQEGQLRPQEVWRMILDHTNLEVGLGLDNICRSGLFIEKDGQILLPIGGEENDAPRNPDESRGQ